MNTLRAGKKLALLIDPDKVSEATLNNIVEKSIAAKVDMLLIGGSILMHNSVSWAIQIIKAQTSIPVYLFPGSIMQICDKADGILLLSLVSGRNPELLIGQQVLAAPALKASKINIIPTGYILIDGGTRSSVEYMSNTQPIPANKIDIAVCTALAAEQLGMKSVYLEAGSGAKNPISASLISEVSKSVSIPIWVGGGISTPESAVLACTSGAEVVVIGTAFEKNTELIASIAKAIHELNF